VPEPYIQLAMTATILARTGNRELLADVVAGRHIALTAWQETPDTLDVPGTPGTQRIFIPMAAGADACLIPLRNGTRCSLLRVPVGPGNLQVAFTQDGGHYGTLASFPGARVVDEVDLAAVEWALNIAALGTAAYLLGVAEVAFTMTLDYLKSRRQFGKPLGSFQALQHRATDLKIQLELTRASIGSAAVRVGANAPSPAGIGAISRAKARASDAALLITREAIQLHGAIGYTDEYDVGLYLRKALVMAGQYGSSKFHRRRFMSVAVRSGDLVPA
jgi:alkylation response protein AidB-like acyl-CoA dehydrogenase